MANNVDPDQMPRTAASDLCLQCKQTSFCTNKGYYGNNFHFQQTLIEFEKILMLCALLDEHTTNIVLRSLATLFFFSLSLSIILPVVFKWLNAG